MPAWAPGMEMLSRESAGQISVRTTTPRAGLAGVCGLSQKSPQGHQVYGEPLGLPLRAQASACRHRLSCS